MRILRIVVPCYNEAKRLKPEAFCRALEKDPALSFLFVNDGSRDSTLEVVLSIKAMHEKRVEVLNLKRNSGKAEAVRLGTMKALEEPCDYVGYWDADLATPLEAIDEFCTILDRGADLVIGSRVCLLGRNIQRNAWRHYLGRVFATFASLLLNLKVYDTQCGAKIFRNTPALQQVFGKPYKVNWIFDVEILARFLLVRNPSLAEVSSYWVEHPLLEWVDVKGSKIGLKDYIRGGFEYFILFFYLRTPARNIYLRYLEIKTPPHNFSHDETPPL